MSATGKSQAVGIFPKKIWSRCGSLSLWPPPLRLLDLLGGGVAADGFLRNRAAIEGTRGVDKETIILRAYREAVLAAREKGLVGEGVQRAVLQAAAKVSSRILGEAVAPDEVRQMVVGRQ